MNRQTAAYVSPQMDVIVLESADIACSKSSCPFVSWGASRDHQGNICNDDEGDSCGGFEDGW